GEARRDRYFHYFVLVKGDEILLSTRSEGDVWANLHEFPMLETEHDSSLPEIYENADFKRYFGNADLQQIHGLVAHILSYQIIFARFYLVSNINDSKEKKSHWLYVNAEKIDTLAKHKLIFTFWEKFYLS